MKIRQDLIESFELVNQSEKRWLEEYMEMCKSDGVIDQVGLEQNTRYVSKNFGSVAGFNTELLINPLEMHGFQKFWHFASRCPSIRLMWSFWTIQLTFGKIVADESYIQIRTTWKIVL